MAHVRKVPSGWRFEIARNGIRQSRTFKTKAAGDLWASAQEAEILDVKRGALPRKSFRDTLERYRDEISPRKKGCAFEVKRINAFLRDFPDLAKLPAAEIDGSHLAEWRDARIAKVTRGAVQRDINVLSNVFTIARDEWKWVRDTPFRGFRAPGDNPPRQRVIQAGEVRRIVRWLGYRVGQAPVNKSAECALAFLISLRTGMRAGEVLSLNQERIDRLSRVAHVPHKTMHLTGRPRSIPLSKHALRLLQPFQRGFKWSVSSASLDALFRKARESLLISDLHFHDARANALTRFARKVDVMELAKISGHKDLRILLDVYYRVTPAEIARRLDSPISPRPRAPSDGASGSG
jgi:integrase